MALTFLGPFYLSWECVTLPAISTVTNFVTLLLPLICKRLAILIWVAHFLLSVKLDAASSSTATRKSSMNRELREIICANRKFSGPVYRNNSISENPQLWHAHFHSCCVRDYSCCVCDWTYVTGRRSRATDKILRIAWGGQFETPDYHDHRCCCVSAVASGCVARQFGCSFRHGRAISAARSVAANLPNQCIPRQGS